MIREQVRMPRISVAVNICNEAYSQIHACLTRLRENMSTARVTVISNGDTNDEVMSLIASLGFGHIVGLNLGTNSTWNEWWLRMLKIFADSNSDVCFKFDPDTMVDCPPRNIPTDGYFGDVLLNRRGRFFVQGGVTGLSRTAVQDLLVSKVLERRSLSQWGGVPDGRSHFMDDQLISEALHHLGIAPTSWNECKSAWRIPIRNQPIQYSIVHPRYYYDF